MNLKQGDLRRIGWFLIGALFVAMAAEAYIGTGAGLFGLVMKEYADAKHSVPGSLKVWSKWTGIAKYMVSSFSFLQWGFLGAVAVVLGPLFRLGVNSLFGAF